MVFVDGLLWSILIGGVAGWLAGQILRGRGFGILWNIIIGVVGGALANVVIGVISLVGISVTPWSLVGRLITATLGAILLIYLLQWLRLSRKVP